MGQDQDSVSKRVEDSAMTMEALGAAMEVIGIFSDRCHKSPEEQQAYDMSLALVNRFLLEESKREEDGFE